MISVDLFAGCGGAFTGYRPLLPDALHFAVELDGRAVSATESKGTNYRADGSGPQGGPPRASDGAYLAWGRRRLTWRECATLQAFPRNYPWPAVPAVHLYRMVGNAVPPPLSFAVTSALLQEHP